MEMNRKLPNATATLVLGILSIVTCCCGGIPGIILGIIALAISSKDVQMYKQSPESFTDYGNLKAGRIMAIIGLSLSFINIIFSIIYTVFLEGDMMLFIEELIDEITRG